MSADQSARLMLARIDERVKAIADDVTEIRRTRQCQAHNEKIRSLERVVYGVLMAVFGLVGKAVHDLLR